MCEWEGEIMKMFFEIIFNSDRFINILVITIAAAADLTALISFIKSNEKRAVKLFVIIFFTVILIVLMQSIIPRYILIISMKTSGLQSR